ncbi:MAG: hypothetical protein GX321_03575, partial [Clostridiales bacterium]|nr:hypothetical protein [Clostridiales bacterium]
FAFKDYDMVMSLPVKNSDIVASRLILLYSINFTFTVMVMIPMMLAYGILARPDWLFYVFGLISVLLIPLIPIVIASILGTIVTYVAMGFRYSNGVYIILTLLMFLAMIIVPFYFQGSEEDFARMHLDIANQIKGIYPLAGLYSQAVIEYNITAMAIFALISIIAFVVYSLVVGKLFVKINTSIMTSRAQTNYMMGELKTSSPIKSLFKKELMRYFSSNVYVMNTGFGIVILVIIAIALPFVDPNTISSQLELAGAIQDVIPMVISFCIATTCTTMASISIEGKNLWILKSLPLAVEKIFLSKVLVNLTITMPAYIATIIIGITLKIPFIQGIIMVLTTILFSLFVALYGLVINLSFPHFSWTTETTIVKQSTSSMISIFTGLGMVAVQFGLWMVTGTSIISNLIFIAILILLNIFLYIRLTRTGIQQFQKL